MAAQDKAEALSPQIVVIKLIEPKIDETLDR
jgi:hypothetical protein